MLSQQTKVLCAAAADSDGEVDFYQATHSPLSSLFPIASPEKTLRIPTVSLDAVFDPEATVNLIQIDAEGAEPLIYNGMRRIIEQSRDLELVLEWSASHFARSGRGAAAFAEQLRRDGFHPHAIAEDGDIRPCSDLENLEGANLLFSRSIDVS
jgi:hypothetical protein